MNLLISILALIQFIYLSSLEKTNASNNGQPDPKTRAKTQNDEGAALLLPKDGGAQTVCLSFLVCGGEGYSSRMARYMS